MKCHVFLEKCTFETPKPNQGFVYCSSRVQKAKFSNFNKPIWAIVVFWVAEKSAGMDLKDCSLTDSGLKLKEIN